jgi:hypothetical protein
MKRCNWLLAAVMAMALVIAPIQFAQADEQGWGLMIKSPHVGILYLYITNEGFAIVIKETGAKFVTHAPEWRVVMYNDKSQVYYVERLSDLQVLSKSPKGKKQQEMMRAASGRVRVGRSEVIGGLPATQYFINTISPEGGAREAEVWITRSIVPPAKLHETMQKLFNIDVRDKGIPEGLPIRVKMADEGGKREMIMDTINAQRQMIRTASFTYPTTYKKVDSELAVLMDEKSRKKMESILDDSDDLSSILGSSSSTPSRSNYQPAPTSAYRPASGTAQRPAYATQARPGGAAAGAKPGAKQGQGDWWNNMFNSLGGK